MMTEVRRQTNERRSSPNSAKVGRPVMHQMAEYGDEICEWIANGKTLRAYCRQKGKPNWVTIYRWKAQDEKFARRLAEARDLGEDAIVQECFAIADTPMIGKRVKEGPHGTEITRQDMLGHRKLQIWTRLQLLAKWNPTKYGDRTTLAGDKDNPLIPQQMSDEERAAKITAILNAATSRKNGK
jgi:hypothetical protein